MNLTDGTRRLTTSVEVRSNFISRLMLTNPLIAVLYRLGFPSDGKEAKLSERALTDVIKRLDAFELEYSLTTGGDSMDGNAWRDLVTGKTSEQAMPFLETGNPIYAIAFGIKGDHRGQDTVYLASMAFYSTPDFTPSNAPELLAYMAATDMDPGRMAQAHDWRNAQPVESPDSFITDPSCPMRLGYLFRETEARVWAWHRKYTEDCPCGFPWVCELGIFVREVDTDTVRKILANGPEGVAAIVPDAL